MVNLCMDERALDCDCEEPKPREWWISIHTGEAFMVHECYSPFPRQNYIRVREVEDEDPTPWCHVCGAMQRKHCACPDPFYADNH